MLYIALRRGRLSKPVHVLRLDKERRAVHVYLLMDQSPPTLEGLQRQFLEMQINSLQKNFDDHEKRLRLLEDTATRFNFLLYLTMGGGLVSLFNLFAVGALVMQNAVK